MVELPPPISSVKTVYKVSDFLSFLTSKTLVLSPSFQRRPVWKPGAKSLLIDSLIRGLPVPIILIRERLDLEKKETIREVVDGQQRLRTVLSFVSPEAFDDYDPARDPFTVKAIHNPEKEIAGKAFPRLPPVVQRRILGYEFSTHVLDPMTDDRDLLQIFARLNSTGAKLTSQELRNSDFSGEFKTLMYRLALEQLDRWRSWKIFTEDQIARMKEVELVSDLTISYMEGIVAKRQPKIDAVYKQYDETFSAGEELSRRMRRVFDVIDEVVGRDLAETAFQSEVMFYSLAVLVYDLMWGLGKPLTADGRGKATPSSLRADLLRASSLIRSGDIDADILDAIGRAPVDQARRVTRHRFLVDMVRG